MRRSHNTAITFDNVTFSYPTTDRPVINSMSFSIDEGQTVAFVGNSGCGKSTILRLLYRFYDVHQKDGRISFGGENVRNLTADSFRKAIAVIPQDIVLFNDTIEYNINYGNWDRGREEVVEAAKKAKVSERREAKRALRKTRILAMMPTSTTELTYYYYYSTQFVWLTSFALLLLHLKIHIASLGADPRDNTELSGGVRYGCGGAGAEAERGGEAEGEYCSGDTEGRTDTVLRRAD